MANRYFNKQVAESRKPLASGSMVKAISEAYKPKGEFSKKNKKSDPRGTSKSGKKPAGWTLVKPSPTTKKSRMEERMKKMERPRPKKTSESPERKKRQADYMKKHGKKPSSRKTLSVTNSYKKEVEGLK